MVGRRLSLQGGAMYFCRSRKVKARLLELRNQGRQQEGPVYKLKAISEDHMCKVFAFLLQERENGQQKRRDENIERQVLLK